MPNPSVTSEPRHEFRYKVKGLETSHERCACGHQHGSHDKVIGCTYGSRRNGICQCTRFRRAT